jgi:dihydroflavonol-4-reductase
VQGPGRLAGTAKFLIALLDGRLRAFVDTHLSLVDLDDCVDGHVLAAERGRAGERYVLSAPAVTTRGIFALVAELSQRTEAVRLVPAPVAQAAAAAVEAACRATGRRPPVCRQMVGSVLHGHRYDASRAARELGATPRPLRETVRRTAAWAVAEGHVTRPLPGLR